ncbi:TonB-dependent siderophore receptor [Billgrantia sp. LNSP4103-1]|uniref:TonB-dependent siderophore receptor n=1 Tax=Billgrantia sp. LNSP4103-1 TaxID=3410266 RepID=UPI00403FAEEB
MSRSCFVPLAHPLTQSIRHALGLMVTGALAATPLLAIAQAESEQMDTVVVVGTALKVDTPLVETPRPVSSVDQQELERRNVQQLDETFRYRAGVLSGHYGADNDTDWFEVRGLDHSTYQDGLRIYREGYYHWVPETYGLERVEIFKGPSSILYGEAPPGGLINAVSKRPTAEPQGRFDLQLGNRDHRHVGVDSSGPLTDSGDVRYRLVGTWKEREGDLDHTTNERYYFAPSLEVDFSDDTSLTILASMQKDDAVPVNPFKPSVGTLSDTPFGKIDRQTNLSQPEYDTNERTQSSLGYELERWFSDTWRFEQNLRYSELDLLLHSSYASQMLEDNRSISQGHVHRDGEINSWTMDNRMIGSWYGDGFENTLLLGVDYQDLKLQGWEFDDYGSFGIVDAFAPEYGNFTVVDYAERTRREIEKQQTGIYAQNQLRLADRWVLLGGARYDQAETRNDSRAANGEKTAQYSDDNHLTLSGGIMYLGEGGWNPYLSYAESFSPPTFTGEDGELHQPSEGEQWELGMKFAPEGWDGYMTAAIFDLKESNSLWTRPNGTQAQVPGSRSQGFEVEGSVQLSEPLRLTAAYTYTDARNTETDQRLSGIPRHQASTWIDYAYTQGTLSGLQLGGGVRHVGSSVDGELTVPDYTMLDAMVRYDLDDSWRLQLNVNNLTDETYVASCNYWCYYGESRSVIGSLSYRW